MCRGLSSTTYIHTRIRDIRQQRERKIDRKNINELKRILKKKREREKMAIWRDTRINKYESNNKNRSKPHFFNREI